MNPHNAQVPALLLVGLAERAAVLGRLGRPAEAVADWDRALRLAPAAQRASFRVRRAAALARAGDAPRATAEVEELAQGSLPGPDLYALAGVHALAAAGLARETSGPPPERAGRAERHAGRAVALLIRAAASGHFRDAASLARLDEDGDLAALRDREDYKAFRAGLGPKQ